MTTPVGATINVASPKSIAALKPQEQKVAEVKKVEEKNSSSNSSTGQNTGKTKPTLAPDALAQFIVEQTLPALDRR